MRKTLIIFTILFFTSSCVKEMLGTMPKSWNWGAGPRIYMAKGLPDGDDDFSRGFQDGCRSMLGVVAQGMVRNIKPRYDGWKLTSNKLYAAGFLDGEEHCTYIYDWDIW
jgi:hypothetical protein